MPSTRFTLELGGGKVPRPADWVIGEERKPGRYRLDGDRLEVGIGPEGKRPADLSGKRGQVTGTDSAGGDMAAIRGMAPLSELADYQTRLKSVTGGHGSFSIDFSHYAPVPPHTQAQLVSKHKQPVEEEG